MVTSRSSSWQEPLLLTVRCLSLIHILHAAQLIREECYGKAVAQVGGVITHNDLKDVAGKTKLVPPDHQLVRYARDIGISFGDEKTEKKK